MAKYPIVGNVKTRLGEAIGYKEATELYLCFLKDIVEKVTQLGTPFFIYHTPSGMGEEFKKLLGEEKLYVPQKGVDLGERLHNGFKESLKLGYSGAIALASDIPDLPQTLLRNAVNGMESNESVLGPSPDGGYYLIGLQNHAVSSRIFRGINWSTESVYSETVEVIRTENLSFLSLEKWSDVDQVSDLQRLVDSQDTEFHKTRTWSYLKTLYL